MLQEEGRWWLEKENEAQDHNNRSVACFISNESNLRNIENKKVEWL
jgi:hypothetical protein